MTDAQVKSLAVPQSVLDDLRSNAVLESEAAKCPGRPLLVDTTKTPNKYGLPPRQIKELRTLIVPGSGKSE